MLISKSQLCVRKAASTDSTRHNLNGIYIEPDGSVTATDGHWLAHYAADPEGQPDPTEFPSVSGFEPSAESVEAFILPRVTADALAKAIPKRSHMPILKNAALDVKATNGGGVARFVTTDLESSNVTEGKKIDGEFPNYRHVMPTGEPTATVHLNAHYLRQACEIAREFDPASRSHMVKLEIFDALSPIRITCESPDIPGKLIQVIMPIPPDSGKARACRSRGRGVPRR